MPIFNVRLAAIILVSLIVGGGGVHWLHGFQVNRNARVLKDASERAEEGNNYKEAIRLLRDYVILKRTDRGAELHLAKLYFEEGHFKAALDTYEEGLRMIDNSEPPVKPEQIVEARRQLVKDVAMDPRVRAYSAAEAHLEILLDGAVEKNLQHKKNGEKLEGDPELLVLYGQLLSGYRLKDKEACEIFRDAMTIAPDQFDAYLCLAASFLARKQVSDADEVVDSMLAKNGKSMDAYDRYIDYYLRRGKFDKAYVKAEQAQKLSPEDPRGMLSVGRCYMAKREYAKAEEFLRKGVALAKDNKTKVAAYRLLADAQSQLNKTKDMIESLGNAQKAAEGNSVARGAVALDLLWERTHAQIASGSLPEAAQNITELRDRGYPAARIDFLDARIALQKKDWAKAKRLLKDSVIPGTYDRPVIRCMAYFYLAQCWRQEGIEAEQIAALEQAAKIDAHNFQVRSMLAELYMSHGKAELAAEQYRLAAQGPQSFEARVNWLRTMIVICMQAEESKRDWTAVNTQLDKLLEDKPGRPDLVVLKAEVLLHQGKEDQAAEVLKACTAKEPKGAEAWLAMVRLGMHRADKEKDPAKKAALWKETAGYVDQAEKNLGDRIIVRLARGSYAVLNKDPQVADVLKKLGENTAAFGTEEKRQLWSILATLSDQANEYDLCRDYYRQLAAADSNDIRPLIRLCELQLRAFEKKRPVDEQELDRLAKEIERLTGQGPFWHYAKAVGALVRSKNAKNDPLLVEARDHLLEAMKVRNDWAALAVMTGKICELQDEPDQALEFYLRAIHFGNRDSDVVGRAAQMLVARRRLDDANKLFVFLEKQKSPLLDEMPREYGLVKVFLGDIAEAEKLVEKSVAADSKNAKDFLWQGEMYAYLTSRLKAMVQNEVDHAKEALANAKKAAGTLQNKPDDNSPEQWNAEADAAKAKAVKYHAAMLRMAQRSVDSLMTANRLDPQDDEVWIALVQVVVDINQADNAKKFIADAQRMLKSDKALATIGRCWELLNEPQKAEENYLKAAKALPDNTRILRQLALFYIRAKKFDAAEPQLRKIISLQTPATLNDACWARHALAVVLKSRGEFDALCEAARLIDENINSKLASTNDLRLKVDLLMADPRKEKLNDAIATMEKLVEVAGATPDDHFDLAQLYLRKGDKANYEEQMRDVLAAEYVRPQHLISYIAALMDRKEFEDADRWLKILEMAQRDPADEKLKKLNIKFAARPASFDTLRTRAEYLFRRGRYADAADAAMTFVQQFDPTAADRSQCIYFAAMLMEGFANRLKTEHQQAAVTRFAADAETLFGSLRNPKVAKNGIFVYADFLARQKRIAESLARLEAAWNKDNANELLPAAMSIIKSGAATPAQCDQLEKLLVATAQVNRSTGALLVLSGLHEQQRRYDKAMQNYREILAKEPRNYRAMNNLSVDLARTNGNLDEALTMVNQALAICGPLSDILDSRGLVYIARQEYDKALVDLNAAIRDDGSAEQCFHQAWVLSLMDRRGEAAEAFKTAQAKGLDPKLLNALELPWYDRLKNSL
jgi:cellulose synthase operon protein C